MMDVSTQPRSSVPKEYDYIGLSMASSSATARMGADSVSEDAAVPLQETDLRLDLGLGLGLGSGLTNKVEEEQQFSQASNHGAPQLDGSSVPQLGSPVPKNWMKRGFSETTAFSMPSHQKAECDAASSKQSFLFPTWAPSKSTIPAWQLEKTVPPKSSAGSHTLTGKPQEAFCEDAPPAKDQVVGWPPVRSYRRQNLSKPLEMFVKVNMDGITVGRKVDLNTYTSYESLLLALEEMFQPSTCAQGVTQASPAQDSDLKHFLVSNGADFVLSTRTKTAIGCWLEMCLGACLSLPCAGFASLAI
ncbi:hypothetical protein L7F22_016414 [Adiantum nelumboides]|nr:hypothetical protein [Adiantum nelumboides]